MSQKWTRVILSLVLTLCQCLADGLFFLPAARNMQPYALPAAPWRLRLPPPPSGFICYRALWGSVLLRGTAREREAPRLIHICKVGMQLLETKLNFRIHHPEEILQIRAYLVLRFTVLQLSEDLDQCILQFRPGIELCD